ncbi:MAG: OmpH family outer membrane protein [Alphaproteobacteria bacterium]
MKKTSFMRTSVTALAILVISGIGATAMAQSAQTAKVLVVDSAEILRSSLAGKDLTRQVETQSAQLEAERDRLRQEVRAQEQELQRQAAILSPEALQERGQAAGQKFAAAQQDLEDKLRRYQIGTRKAERELQSTLTPIYQELLNKYGANLIFERSTLVMTGTGLDITREVVERLDQTLSTIKLDIPAAGAATGS